MDIVQITFLPKRNITTITKSNTISDAAKKLDINLASPCGGRGACGKCTIKLIRGKLNTSPYEGENVYLACISKPLTDCVVEVIKEETYGLLATDDQFRLSPPFQSLNPAVKKELLDLRDYPPESTRSLLETLCEKISPPLPNVTTTLKMLQKISFLPSSPLETLELIYTNDGSLLDCCCPSKESPLYGVAIDLGTTTIDLAVVDFSTGEAVYHNTIYNKQRQYGQDVISRIIYAEKNNAVSFLQEKALIAINQLLEDFNTRIPNGTNHIYRCVIAANTTMSHLLLGLNPSEIRKYPYIPPVSKFPTVTAREIGLSVHPESPVTLYPCVSAFVGGDILAGIISTQLHHTEKLSLLVDLGTNGEIVLGNKDWLISCSCSAGPAFEGASISCGTRPVPGAINRFSLESSTLTPVLTTIDDVAPVGVCGSAIIDILACLFHHGLLDKQGKLVPAKDPLRVRSVGAISEYVLAFKDDDILSKDITINENDINNILRTKAAIFAGITMLLASMGLGYTDLETVYIAGTLGKHINIENAVSIGLLPDIDRDKYRFAGNTSLVGAYLYLIDHTLNKEIDSLYDAITYLDLSDTNDFMDFYTASLFIPHTDSTLFPSVFNR